MRQSPHYNPPEQQDALKTISDALDGLERDVRRFEDENGRDVISDVETATTDIRNAFDKLRQALEVQNSYLSYILGEAKM